MQFKDIIGQHHIKQHLITTVKENRISHNQIFFGTPGNGKLALAIAYAQYINCADRTDSDSCGVCSSCVKYQKLIHPDLHFVFPVVIDNRRKLTTSDDYIYQWREYLMNENYFVSLEKWMKELDAENKQGVIGKDESHNIIKTLSLKSYESEYKTMIIWLPEKMNNTSANKLLKLMEEPPQKTLFIMVSENTDDIIVTITSRAQITKVGGIETEDLEEFFKNNFEVDHELIKSIVQKSDGNYLKAVNMLITSEEDKETFNDYVAWMRLIFQRDVPKIYDWVEKVGSLGREKQKNFLKTAINIVRENIVYNFDKEKLTKTIGNELEFIKNFHIFVNRNSAPGIYELLNDAHYHIERNAYGKLVFFDLSIQLMKYIKPNK